jgi:phosphomannomutase
MSSTPPIDYQCPDERHPISREVHLARLATFYPKCRQCAHCHDTGSISSTRVRALVKVRARQSSPRPFKSEGFGGVYLNDFTPADARNAAAAFGIWLRKRHTPATSERPQRAGLPSADNDLTVVLASDGRPMACELVAAASNGLRWSGCRVIDVGRATSPALIAHARSIEACGALLVGNALGRPDTAELRFWDELGCPLSLGGGLEEIERLLETGLDRPTRRFGTLTRGAASHRYLMGLSDYFHAMRPLRLVLDTSCSSLIDYLRELTANVTCEVMRHHTCGAGSASGIAGRVVSEGAHFGISIDGDGEACRLYDERGRAVPAEQLVLLLARQVMSDKPGATVVVEHDLPESVAERLAVQGGQVVRTNVLRSDMHRAMRTSGAELGGGSSGRFWFAVSATEIAAVPIADALRTLALLLTTLSQGDRPLSELLEAILRAG